MPRFLLLLAPEKGRGATRPLPGHRLAHFAEWVAQGTRQGVIRSGARLHEHSLRIDRGHDATVVLERCPDDGGEFSAYLVIEAENVQSALAIASSCPGADPGVLCLYQLDMAAALGDAYSDAATVG